VGDLNNGNKRIFSFFIYKNAGGRFKFGFAKVYYANRFIIYSRDLAQDGTMDEWQLNMLVTLDEYFQILAQRAAKQGIQFLMDEDDRKSEAGKYSFYFRIL